MHRARGLSPTNDFALNAVAQIIGKKNVAAGKWPWDRGSSIVAFGSLYCTFSGHFDKYVLSVILFSTEGC